MLEKQVRSRVGAIGFELASRGKVPKTISRDFETIAIEKMKIIISERVMVVKVLQGL
jgi:hypothetical protein